MRKNYRFIDGLRKFAKIDGVARIGRLNRDAILLEARAAIQ